MAVFQYQAIDLQGKQIRGVLDADSARQARQLIREQGLNVVHVEEAADQLKKRNRGFSLFRWRISINELTLLTRQLSTLVAAALPIEEALKAISQQAEKPQIASLITAVRNKVLEGHTLANAMAEFPQVFNQLYRAMIAAGEASGHLDIVLERLADYTEQRQIMRMKTLQALIYPAVLTFIAVAVIAILLAAVVPSIIEQFIHMKQTLPLSTRMLINLSDFTREFGPYLLFFLIIGLVFFFRLLKKPEWELRWHKRLLTLPIVGRVSKGQNTARYARTLSILNSSAVPLLRAMQISCEVLTNSYARQQLALAAERVREGASLNASLSNTGLFPAMMLHMIASGERSGTLNNMLGRAADNQDREFSAQVTMALSIFEPVLIVTMASVVLFIVMSILQPLLQLNNMASF